jgi:XTP/dITP diphosphohydrolase
MSRIVLASNNPGKVREFNALLTHIAIQVLPQADLAIPEAAETGLSFVENAIIKARNAAVHSGLPAIADDSGIEVDALNGAPGIRSARYAGGDASDEANNRKLLRALDGVPEAERTARYQCLIVYLAHPEDPTPIICEGSWEGRILASPRGEAGFGYDPIFYVPTHGCSSAELDPEVKNELSHRGKALRQLLDRLKTRRPAG